MKTVVLSGYYGFDNAGDEALLWSIAGQLRRLKPDLRVIVLSANPARTRELYSLEAVSRINPLAVLSALARADLLISGGGSLLQDVTSWWSILYYLGIVLAARLLGTPVMYYAQGVGPIRRRWTRWLTRWVSDRVNLITLRDEDSRREMHQLGVTRPPVIVTADPVLGLPPEQWAGGCARPEGGPGESPGIIQPEDKQDRPPRAGISLRRWGGAENLLPAVAQAADRLVERGWEVVFLPFHHPDDLAVSRQAAALMRQPSRVEEEPLTARALLQRVGELDLLMGMRLHSLVFAAVNGVPLLGISYDPKVDAFLETLGRRPAGRAAAIEAGELVSRLDRLLEDLAGEREDLRRRARQLRQRAELTARLALGLIGRSGRLPRELLDPGEECPMLPGCSPVHAVREEPPPGSPTPTSRPRVEVLGAGLDAVNLEEALERISGFIAAGRPRQVITLNAEILYRAQSEPALLELINRADLVTADGAGVVWAAGQLGRPVPGKVTGVDLVLNLAPRAEREGWRVFLLGGEPGVAEEAAISLLTSFPRLDIAGTHHGFFAGGSPEERRVLSLIEERAPHLLLVARGSPRQEYWIREHLDAGRLMVPVSIGVGGVFDLLAGRVRRAPRWMLAWQLEWLWRLIQEPWRWRRMLALPRFVLLVWNAKTRRMR